MMMIPRKNTFDIFEDMFNDSFFKGNEPKMMKTDIKEDANKYIIDIDLPGYEKENIKISVEDGYLTIQAVISSDKEEKSDKRYVRRERYSGSCSRSFYVGEDIKSEDIKANFRNGILKIEIPKKDEQKKLPETKYIEIDD